MLQIHFNKANQYSYNRLLRVIFFLVVENNVQYLHVKPSNIYFAVHSSRHDTLFQNKGWSLSFVSKTCINRPTQLLLSLIYKFRFLCAFFFFFFQDICTGKIHSYTKVYLCSYKLTGVISFLSHVYIYIRKNIWFPKYILLWQIQINKYSFNRQYELTNLLAIFK